MGDDAKKGLPPAATPEEVAGMFANAIEKHYPHLFVQVTVIDRGNHAWGTAWRGFPAPTPPAEEEE